MNDFFDSLKADLLDRRLLPLAGLALAALVAALAYLALGGGSSSPATPTASVPPAAASPATSGIAVSEVSTGTNKAVAETTDGFKTQRKGSARNPFTPLAGASTVGVSQTLPTSTSTGTPEPSSGGSSESSGSGKEETKEPAKEPKPKTVYHVTVLFGSLTPDPTTGEVVLTPHVNLKLFTPLPSTKQPLLVFRGVTAGGKAATFTVVGEAILNGNGACLPSAFQCHALDLKPGQSEQLEYLPPGGTAVVSYELRVVAIDPVKAKAGQARVARNGESAAGWEKSQEGWSYLYKAGLLEIPDLRQSSQPGVLVFAPHPAKKGRARTAVHGPRLNG